MDFFSVGDAAVLHDLWLVNPTVELRIWRVNYKLHTHFLTAWRISTPDPIVFPFRNHCNSVYLYDKDVEQF